MFIKDGVNKDFVEFRFCDYLPKDFPRLGRYCLVDALQMVNIDLKRPVLNLYSQAKDMYITSDPIVC